MTRFVKHAVGAASVVLLVVVVLGFGGAVLFPLDLLAHFRLHFLLMIPVFSVPALLLGCWPAVLRLTTAAVLAVAGLSPLWEAHSHSSDGFSLTVMNANLRTHNDQPERSRAALIAADADVLITHETTKAMQEGTTSLARHYSYRLSLNTSGRQLRTMIWSKFPMSQGELLLDDQVEPTGAVALVDLGEGRDVLIVGLHMAHTAVGNQETQIEALDEVLAGRPEPRVILGDFNATPWSWAMRRIAEITNTRRLPGYRITWRGIYPSFFGDIPAILGQPIDHILASDSIGYGEIDTLVIPGSDHLAVKATLLMP